MEKQFQRRRVDQATLILCGFVYAWSTIIDYSKPLKDSLFFRIPSEEETSSYLETQMYSQFEINPQIAYVIVERFDVPRRIEEAISTLGEKLMM